ncbi:hypothetical protein [Micromonospora sp. B006]|uniref:hypothetical protein n=1 Tax=Micromonospora sp. B006 TaxID=2201999 RepID=UPI000E3072CC|nr:hypothetical protein [Micromonospora sp. B006]AXO37569.1 hypothetical protein MicB006_5307 [Micromonospora sp. B006]
MRGWFRLTLGLLAVVLGALWTVLGLGYVEGSVLSDERNWVYVGVALILIGLAGLWWGMRARRR